MEARLELRLIQLEEELRRSQRREARLSEQLAAMTLWIGAAGARLCAVERKLRDSTTALAASVGNLRLHLLATAQKLDAGTEGLESDPTPPTAPNSVVLVDAVRGPVDTGAAVMETGLVERPAGPETVRGTSFLRTGECDLRPLHAEVAATQRAIRELRRRVPASRPVPSSSGTPHPPADGDVVPGGFVPYPREDTKP